MPNLKHFRFWCQSVLPLVYDDSLSYYEVLCKITSYINNLIDTDKEIFSDIDDLKADMEVVQGWIDNYDENIESIVREYIPRMVFFGLTDDGYFVAYIPDSWEDIDFRTTGWDYNIDDFSDYGHLCLLY